MDQNAVEYLKNFKSLLDEGFITQEEFDAKKAELLPVEKKESAQEISSVGSANVEPKKTDGKSKHSEIDLGSLLGSIIMLFIGVLVFILGLGGAGTELRDVTFQADYYTYQYKATVCVVQTLSKVVMAIGLALLCFGLKDLLKEVLRGKTI